ncbi:MAG: hypothetical protein Q8913_05665, partial [Bacteroidota bacterium]|nr:hypothetical protein [Bacteroidota bacterium]
SNLFAGTSNGVFISINDGNSWSRTSGGLNDGVNALTAIGSILFAGTADSGVYRSTDGGLSWKQMNTGLTSDTITALGIVGSNLFAGTTREGIFLSTDSGASWNRMNSGLADPKYPDQTTIMCLEVSGDTIFSGAVIAGSVGFFRSTDSARTWVEIGKSWAVAIAILGENIIIGGGYSVGVSHDKGAHWINSNAIVPTCFYVNGTTVYSVESSDGAIYRSLDSGTTWSLVSGPSGFGAQTPFIAADKSLLMGDGGIWRSLDSGETWSRADSGTLLSSIVALAKNGDYLFAGTAFGVYVSSDDGVTWEAANDGLSSNMVQSLATIGSYLYAGAISAEGISNPDPRYPPKVWLVGSGIFRSTNNGGSWSEIKNFLEEGDSIWRIDLFASETNLFANGLRSTDSGVTWLDNSKSPDPIAVSGNSLFGISYPRVYFSTNEGSVWTPVSSDLPSNHQIVWAASGPNIFAGTYDSGVFVLKATSNSWLPINAGLADTQINKLFVADGYLYALGGWGFWRRPLADFGISSGAQTARTDGIAAAYPNPFSLSTTISFTPEASGYADVSVVNLLGVEVARIFSGELAAGERTFTWNPTGLSDGIYECLVRMNGRVEKLAVMLLR